MREGAAAHHQAHAGDTAECFVDVLQLGGYGFCRPDDKSSRGSPLGVEGRTARWSPAALAADAPEGMRVGGPELFGSLGIRVRDIADCMHRDIQRLRRVARTPACLAVEVDERPKAVGLPADDGDRQRQPQQAGAGKAVGRSPHAEADGQDRLHGPGPYTLACQRGPVPAAPVHLDLVAQMQQEIQLLGEELIVVAHIETEERVGFRKRAATHDDLGTSVRDQVQGGKLLEDADRIVRAEHRDRAGETDTLRARGCRSQEHRRRGRDVFLTMVLPDGIGVQTDAVGESNLFQHLPDALPARFGCAFAWLYQDFNKCVDAHLHVTSPPGAPAVPRGRMPQRIPCSCSLPGGTACLAWDARNAGRTHLPRGRCVLHP